MKGKVVFTDGSPLTTGGLVMSEPVSPGELPVNARGSIAPDGSFQLSTYGDGDGAVAGEHRFLVRAQRTPLDEMAAGRMPPQIIHRRFESFDTSGLQFTVKEEPNEFTLEVERPAKPARPFRGDL